VPHDGQGFLLADPPGMVLLTVVQPEPGRFSSDGDSARQWFAGSGGRLAGAVHDGNEFGFLKNDAGGVAKRDHLFVLLRNRMDVLIQTQNFSGVAGRKHLANEYNSNL
jgi:hypothetical protein